MGPLAASAIILVLMRSAFLPVITLSRAAGTSMSHSISRISSLVIMSVPAKPRRRAMLLLVAQGTHGVDALGVVDTPLAVGYCHDLRAVLVQQASGDSPGVADSPAPRREHPPVSFPAL